MKTKKKQLLYACLMTLSGIAAVSMPAPQIPEWVYNNSQETVSLKHVTIPQILPSLSVASPSSKEVINSSSIVRVSWADMVEKSLPVKALDYYQPSVMVLNLSNIFPEDADTSDRLNSLAGEIFKELSLKDSQWLTNIYLFANHTPEALAEGLGLSREQVLGKYNPGDKAHDPNAPNTWTVNSWEHTRITFHDGDGGIINGYSNVKELLSLGSVYTFYQGMEDTNLFLNYVNNLWEKSHDYTVHMSDVYYCNGCISEEDYQNMLSTLPKPGNQETISPDSSQTLQETQPQESEAADDDLHGQDMASVSLEGFTEGSGSETASSTSEEEPFQDVEGPGRDAMSLEADRQSQPEETTGSLPSTSIVNTNKGYCPGHLDMSVDVTIIGIDGNRNLFTIDDMGSSQALPNEGTDIQAASEDSEEVSKKIWEGWNTSNQNYARCINYQDWHQLYGLTVSSVISISNPLSESEIQSYLKQLPEDLSETRRQVVEFALRSVGKVPYYWGGKPYNAGYDSNSFGAVIGADEDGRMLRGLDCSGWINWVYWSATGTRLPYESTGGLVTCGTAVSREHLQPGDIIVRLGDMPHVVMFLSWTGDGQMTAIHESSDSNNVTVGTMTADWNHYRKLVE